MSSQPPKDFLALTHGHEWVNFYESFDKLVQDHLSRSSELLRKAMSLPEVADREVAQIRDDLEGQIQVERTKASETLNSLKSDISSTQQQASSLVRLTAAMIGDLDRLAARVDTAISDLQSEPTSNPAEHASTPASETAADAGEAVNQNSDESGENADEIDLNALAEAESASTPEESGEEGQKPGTGDLAATASERSRPHWLNMTKPSTQNAEDN